MKKQQFEAALNGSEIKNILRASAIENMYTRKPNADIGKHFEPYMKFEYGDCENFQTEISELYCYTEIAELAYDYLEFQRFISAKDKPFEWHELTAMEKQEIVLKLLNLLDVACSKSRLVALRCILYIAQGCWKEGDEVEFVLETIRENCKLLNKVGIFSVLLEFVNVDDESSTCLNIILAILYSITECVRNSSEDEISAFNEDIDEQTILKLMCLLETPTNKTPSLVSKKVVLLIWKLLLVKLGGLNDVERLRRAKRAVANLPVDFADNCRMKADVRQVNVILERARLKFFGYTIKNDSSSLFGLPNAVQDAVKTLKKYVYIPLSFIDEITADSCGYETTFTETLYSAMLPSLQGHVQKLLYMLLQVLPKDIETGDLLELQDENSKSLICQQILEVATQRHREIIAKAVTGILILLLKHFKLNHFYQFEYMAAQLVATQCIPVFLNFLQTNVLDFIDSTPTVRQFDFPNCVVNRDTDEAKEYSWRNMFTYINILRILNKVTKQKPLRIVNLIQCRACRCLRATLNVNHPMFQLYALKLLKMQVRYLGRHWRRVNMKTVDKIYFMVRHRYDDKWLNPVNQRGKVNAWKLQEKKLQMKIAKFHNRRYSNKCEDLKETSWTCCAREIELPKDFDKWYYSWLEEDVYNNNFNWDELLS